MTSVRIRQPAAEDPVLIWSNEHSAWWRADSDGYTTDPAGAGIYRRDRAAEMVYDAYIGWTDHNPCPEIIVPVGPLFGPQELQDLAGELTAAAVAAWEACNRRLRGDHG